MGRAYLAFCDPLAQQALLELLAHDATAEVAAEAASPATLQMLAQVRSQGYALRDPRVRPESSTIAVPIFESDRVVATLGLTWFSSTMTSAQAVERFLQPLKQAAGDIALALDGLR